MFMVIASLLWDKIESERVMDGRHCHTVERNIQVLLGFLHCTDLRIYSVKRSPTITSYRHIL